MKHPVGEDWRHGGFGLYVHWPFCASKCPYCDFNSHVAMRIDQAAWREAYIAEIEAWGEKTRGRVLDSLFFGGGTPSLMEPQTVAAVVDAARRTWSFRNSIEITLEANPTSVEAARFQGFSEAGVNRVSLGVQALDDAALRLLGRQHSVKEALAALDIAKQYFARTSFDLIYARQNQSLSDWRRELGLALAFEPEHLSLYQLTIEDGTVFAARHRMGKLPGLPAEDAGADMFDLTQDLCDAAGLPAYEVSNHAKPGQESRHNSIYWNYGDYIGVGPGAHGRVTVQGQRLATESVKAPGAWLDLRRRGLTTHAAALSPGEQASEYLMMALRLSRGADLARFAALGGTPLDQKALDPLLELGLVWQNGRRIGATKAGRPILNAILRALL